MQLKKIVFYGGTGQAKVLRAIVEPEYKVSLIISDVPIEPPWDVPVVNRNAFEEWLKTQSEQIYFCIAIGNPRKARVKLHTYLVGLGLKPLTVIHPSAVIDPSATLGEGCQILAGAIINPFVKIGNEVIVNTGAQIDHECILEDGVEIAPGAVLAGCITVKQDAWVASGAVVLPWLTIGENSIVGAGAVVTKDVSPNTTVIGVPAREK